MNDFLFVTPSFLRGMARTLDLGGVLAGSSYNPSKDGPSADAWAVANDWQVVGDDLRRAMSLAVEVDGKEAKQEAENRLGSSHLARPSRHNADRTPDSPPGMVRSY